MAAALGNLLVDYIQKRRIRADVQQGDTGKGSFSEIFWGDVKTVYDALLDAMEARRDDIEPLCSSSELPEHMFTLGTEASSLCEDIMKAAQGIMPLANVDTSNSACNGLDFDTLQIGHKLVGATIKAWIHNDSTRWHEIMADYVHDSCAKDTSIAAETRSTQDTHAEKEPQGAQGPISLHDLNQLAASKDQLSKHDATTVLNQIQGLPDTDTIMNKLKHAIAAVESETNKTVRPGDSTRSPGTQTTSSSSGSSSSTATSPGRSETGNTDTALGSAKPAHNAAATPQAPTASIVQDGSGRGDEAPETR
ncbi:hypothetical protein AK88_05522 [Plasmodium fragile]|uniref:Schizont-infected cell agglutination extracellular alpha domain-containing protein n=1 Tax=Plasmodium fragile TaxID=5857 RepID=A0A0D9QCV8_PLAFR|nr:uncharacterized protein AK88_05522 [Plasmodium fragile]KJP84843.1 hypothetical protein AK88_05522 [Plasmodium fragile]